MLKAKDRVSLPFAFHLFTFALTEQGEFVDTPTFHIVVAIAAVVITLAFIIQAVVFLKIYGVARKIQELGESLQTKIEPVISKVGPVVEQVQATVINVKTTVDKLSLQAKETFEKVSVETRAIAIAVSTSSQEISTLAQRQAQQLASTLELTNSTLQRQVIEIDGLLTRTQNRIDDTSEEVQMSVLEPVREVAALIAGLRRSIEVLFGRRKQIDQAYHDDEMFI